MKIIAKQLMSSQEHNAMVLGAFSIVRNKITAKTLKANDVKNVLNMSYRQLSDWGRKQERFQNLDQKPAWRLYSIEDLISFRIIQKMLELNLPLDKLIQWIRTMNLVDSVLIPFSNNQQTALYFNLATFGKIYIPGSDKEFVQTVLNSPNTVIVVPLNELIREVFLTVSKKIKRTDFQVTKTKDSKIVYNIDKQQIVIPELQNPFK